jgi:hypothetical protein
MKCIDAIEGTVKCILSRIHEVTLEDRMDDSEYVRSIKAVIDATDDFVEGNQEIVPDRNLLKNVLYSYSKDLWRNTASDSPADLEPSPGEPVGPKKAGAASTDDAPSNHETTPDDDGYRDYYFDYLYRHGVYPR